jgi:hypothetical protein
MGTSVTTPSPPAAPPPPPFPTRLKGTWQRDWRFGTELVDAAVVSFTVDGVFVSGRWSNPIRGAFWISFRLALATLSFATFISVIFTCFGITWRACVTSSVNGGGCDGTWVWFGPLFAMPMLLFGSWVVRRIARRYIEPSVGELVPWAKVQTIATDGRGIDIAAVGKFGAFRARLAPKGKRELQLILAAIHDRRLPGGKGGESGALIRSPWLDRGAALTLLVLTVWGGIKMEPWVTGAAVAVDRPEDAVPPAMTARALDARRERSCAGSGGTASGVRASREGDDLVWEVEGNPAGQVELLRMKAGDARYEVVARLPATAGRKSGFFTGGDAGLVVLAAPGAASGALLAGGRLEDLATASCSGLVEDVALAMPADALGLKAERDGDDLIVDAPSLPGPGRLLAVRRRAGTRGELFRWCEVATNGDDIRTVVAGTSGANFPSFFGGGDDEAVVYFIPTTQFEAARRLAVGGAAQRCLSAESLWASGAASMRAEVTADTQHAMLRWRTGTLAHASPMFVASASSPAVVVGIVERYGDVRSAIRPTPGESDDFDAAFFDAVDWTAVFDVVNFGGDLKTLDRLRAGIASRGGADSGTYALIRVGEAFLDRFPAEPLRYSARFKVGKAWLDAPHALGLNAEAAVSWHIVGRFVLADVGRHLEDDINAGRVGTFDLLRSIPLIYDLTEAGVRIDIQPSNTRKVMVAWLSGDFEYLIDRALKKGAQALGQGGSFGGDKYSLGGGASVGPAVRMSSLLQNGSEIGWVAQYDAKKVRTSWRLGSTVPSGALLAMSAAYSEVEGGTAGIAIAGGRVNNWLWKPDMGGLIVVATSGRSTFIDMRRGGLLNGRFVRPGSSLADFSTVLRDVQSDGGSAFQTYLLAGDGELRLNPDRSSQEIRERRLLALASYKGNPILCVVDLPRGVLRQGYTLYQAAQIAMDALQTPGPAGPGLTVSAVANLDTGARDVMVARDGQGRVVREGQLPLATATNLFVIEPS